MNDNIVHPLFPTFLFSSNLNREFTEEELIFAKSFYENCDKNVGNKTTKESFVLDKKEMCHIKSFIEQKLNVVFYDFLKFTKDSEIYITQSWINYSSAGDFHHTHHHSNSFLSGVFYVDVDPLKDKIVFINELLINSVLALEKTENNMFQTNSWPMPCENGLLYVFPSKLKHNVPKKQDNNLRISLSFNTFVRGTIGKVNEKNGLFLT